MFVDLKFKFGFDDSLDVVGVHLGCGLIGTLALGFIALPVDGEGGGLFYGGGLQQLIAQTVAVLITLAVSGLMTAVIGIAIHKTIGFRVSHEAEIAGVDRSEHAESAYEFGSMGPPVPPASPAHPRSPVRSPGRGAGRGSHLPPRTQTSCSPHRLRSRLRQSAGPGT